MPHSQGLPIIPILSRINPVPPINTYFFKIHSNIVLPSMVRLGQRIRCADTRLRVRVTSCPLDGKLSLKADELKIGQ
jgi:hypothetical protein